MKNFRWVLLPLVALVAITGTAAQAGPKAQPATAESSRYDLGLLVEAQYEFASRHDRFASVQELRQAGIVLAAYKGTVMEVARYAPRSFCLSATWKNAQGQQERLVYGSRQSEPKPESAIACTRIGIHPSGGSFTGKGYPRAPKEESSLEVAAKSDLRNLATNEETLLTDTNAYGTIKEIEANGQPVQVSKGITLRVVRYEEANHYCLSASWVEASKTRTLFYDSAAGGLLPDSSKGCTKATTGKAGDSRTGS